MADTLKSQFGESVRVTFTLANVGKRRARVIADLVVNFVRTRGVGAKTFKLETVNLAPGASAVLSKLDRAPSLLSPLAGQHA